MRRTALSALALALAAAGCASPAPAASPTAPKGAVAPAPPAALAPDHTLARSAVRDVVALGLGAFLQRVEVDEQPVMAGGKFRGFRIASLRGEAFWRGVDLKPGDVVISVNGFPIERPEQAQTAFESLQVSSELRVSYDREGQPRELVYTILDDR
jgi:type II secretory pathway component PulC